MTFYPDNSIHVFLFFVPKREIEKIPRTRVFTGDSVEKDVRFSFFFFVFPHSAPLSRWKLNCWTVKTRVVSSHFLVSAPIPVTRTFCDANPSMPLKEQLFHFRKTTQKYYIASLINTYNRMQYVQNVNIEKLFIQRF